MNGINIKTSAGMSVLVYEVPGIATRIAEQSGEARLRVGAVQVDTRPVGGSARSWRVRCWLSA